MCVSGVDVERRGKGTRGNERKRDYDGEKEGAVCTISKHRRKYVCTFEHEV